MWLSWPFHGKVKCGKMLEIFEEIGLKVGTYSWLNECNVMMVGCSGFNGPLKQYFSLYRAVSQREGERGERIDESKNV